MVGSRIEPSRLGVDIHTRPHPRNDDQRRSFTKSLADEFTWLPEGSWKRVKVQECRAKVLFRLLPLQRGLQTLNLKRILTPQRTTICLINIEIRENISWIDFTKDIDTAAADFSCGAGNDLNRALSRGRNLVK